MVTPAARREAVVHLCEVHAVSQRRACSVIGAAAGGRTTRRSGSGYGRSRRSGAGSAIADSTFCFGAKGLG